jgi:hypothetical protein
MEKFAIEHMGLEPSKAVLLEENKRSHRNCGTFGKEVLAVITKESRLEPHCTPLKL